MTDDHITLGKTGLQLPALGLGTWQWGDRIMWGYGKTHDDCDIQAAFDTSLAAGVNLFDTAEVYGMGRSEQLLGRLVNATQKTVLIATKFFPFPWRLTKAQLFRALRLSLRRLGLKRVDLYQIHAAIPPVPVETWAAALAEAVEAGLTQAVGVSNYSADQMLRADIVLGKYGLTLASNQVRYSLLDRRVERKGLVQLCQERKITLIAYSPVAQGMLTGKYTPKNLPQGLRGRQYNAEYLTRIEPLIQILREIGSSHGGKSPTQVALNWVICKGAIPIPGVKNRQQAEENAGALGWRLTSEEVKALDDTAQSVESSLFSKQ